MLQTQGFMVTILKRMVLFMVKQMGINIILLAFAFFMLYTAFQMPTASTTTMNGPAFYPKLILYVLIGLNLIDMLQKVINYKRENSDAEFTPRIMVKKFILLVVLLGAYIFSLNWIDYRIGTFIMVFAIMFIIEPKRYKRGLIVSAGFVLAIYVIFDYLLRIPMPGA